MDILPGCYVDGSAIRTDEFDMKVCVFVDDLIGSDYYAELGPTPMEHWSEIADEAIDDLNDRLDDGLVAGILEQCLFVTALDEEI